jgi:hypothetical protein
MRGSVLSRVLGRHYSDVRSPRPQKWIPSVFSSLLDAVDFGVI